MLIHATVKELKLIEVELQHHTQSGGKLEIQIIPEDQNSHNSLDYEATTLMHLAAKYGDAEAIQYFIDRGCNVNVTDSSGSTPLLTAFDFNQFVIIQKLLDANADLFLSNNFGMHAVKLALQGPIFSVKFLEKIKSTRKYDSRATAIKLLEINCPLKTSILLEDVSIVRYMLDSGRAVDERDPNHFNRTALHYAVMLENLEIVELLLDRGIDPNIVDEFGEPPLHYYNVNPRDTNVKLEILKLMLCKGASLNIQYGNSCRTLLYDLCRLAKKDTVQTLFEYNRTLVAEGDDGLPLLECLASNKNAEIIDILQRENWNDHSFDQARAIYLATVSGNSKMLELMLRKGLDPDATTRGYTNLAFLYQDPIKNFRKKSQVEDKDYLKCFELLLYHGADPQFIIRETKTFFDFCSSNDFDAAKIVLAHLALKKELGLSIKEIIMAKINIDNRLKKYFGQCKNRLEKMKGTAIYKHITMFKFLTEKEKQIVCYGRNEDLVSKLKFFMNHKRNSKMYYDNILRRRLAYSLKLAKLEDNAIAALFEIPQLQKNILIARMIVDYLDYFDLLYFS